MNRSTFRAPPFGTAGGEELGLRGVEAEVVTGSDGKGKGGRSG